LASDWRSTNSGSGSILTAAGASGGIREDSRWSRFSFSSQWPSLRFTTNCGADPAWL